MGNLRAELDQLQKEVNEFQEALELLKNPLKRYGPQPGQLAPLDFLKAELSSLKSEEERNRLLVMAHQSLANAKERLALKEQELSRLQSDCETIADEMRLAGEAVLAAQSSFQESLKNFEALATRHQPRWSQLNLNRDLYQNFWRGEFPDFVLQNGCGMLTTAAIARDLK